ncbi:MAG: hypoxanthine phosphoribosyltransferase [Clostridiales Family XIII bacterium]|jgi:hypoxanthine phosphoribosyltransferase|nr:hypoxanthine phosphoribosyltransferase [Clostridiales Family XIII bacterium]
MAGVEERFSLGEVLISREQIERRAAEIGEQITQDFLGEEVTFVGILRGAVLWMSEVLKSVNLMTEIDFMAVSSYGAATKSSGIVKINKDLESSITGKNVIIVEDIVDSGITLNYLREYMLAQQPRSLKICTLLDKPAGRKVPIEVDYIGFAVDPVFIVGYGLDVDQAYRNLPYITSVVEKEQA